MSERINNTCPGMIYLRNVLRAAVKDSDSNAQKIMIDDGEDQHFYDMSEAGIAHAARWVLDIDGPITIRVHRATFIVLYDGPYTADSREEIIMDHNERAGGIIDGMGKEGAS